MRKWSKIVLALLGLDLLYFAWLMKFGGTYYGGGYEKILTHALILIAIGFALFIVLLGTLIARV